MDQKIPNGVILPELNAYSLEFGGLSVQEPELLFPDGNLKLYLPNFESQIGTYFDDYCCVSRSMENGLEAVINRKIDSFKPDNQKWLKDNVWNNGKPDFSDRDLGVLSGTIPHYGNSSQKVYDTAKEKGLIGQKYGDWDFRNRNPLENTQVKYYAYSRTKAAEDKAKEFNKRFEIVGEWVTRDKWQKASQYGALQVYVNAWHEKDGKYYNPTGTTNHAVLMTSYNDVQIFDTYQPSIKTLTSWDDCYYLAFKINLIEKIMPKIVLKNNTLCQLVEGEGGFGLYLDGFIFVDSLDKILASWLMRTGGKLDGMTRALTQENWDAFPRKNLRGELI